MRRSGHRIGTPPEDPARGRVDNLGPGMRTGCSLGRASAASLTAARYWTLASLAREARTGRSARTFVLGSPLRGTPSHFVR